jgi:hypothetical protein
MRINLIRVKHMPFCPKCGQETSEDDEYCPNCNYQLKRRIIRPVRRRDEKDEKDEKHEVQNEKSAIMGGLVVSWLGLSLLLQNAGLLEWTDFGGVFLLGLGLIIVFRGLWAYSQSGVFEHGFGYIVGGGFVSLIGAGIAFDLDEWWPVLLIALGVMIVARGFMARSENPLP